MRPAAVLAAYRAGARAAALLPARAVVPVASAIGALTSALAGRRAVVAERNLRRVLGPALHGRELRRLRRELFSSYARYYLESFRLPGVDPAVLAAGLHVDGYEHVDKALADGHAPILALPHLGGWEWAGFYLSRIKGQPVTAVVERLEPPALYEWFVELRGALGMSVVPLGAGAGAAVLRALHDGQVVCLLCDRDLSGDGVEVEFFGERTTVPGGPAMLALRSGAPLLPTAVYFEGDRRYALVRPPVPAVREGRLRDDVERVTRALVAELEVLIARAPEQWHLLQPNWPSDRAALAERAHELSARTGTSASAERTP